MPRLSRRDLLLGGASTALIGTLATAQRVSPVGSTEPPRPWPRRFAVPVPTPFADDRSVDLSGHRKLLQFYRRAGAEAALAVGATGEMLSITWQEALELTRSAHDVFGRAGTWSSLSCGRSVSSCLQGAEQLRRAGCGLPVVVCGLLAGEEVSPPAAVERLLAVARGSTAPLGLYEAPAPFHRTLSPEDLARLRAVGVYRLLKTTQSTPARIRALLQAGGPELAILEAKTTDLFAVLVAGASGCLDFCAAAFPEVVACLVRRWGQVDHAVALRRVAAWIGSVDASLASSLPFPRSVKAVLVARGFPISPISRQAVHDDTQDQRGQVADLVRQFQGLCRDLDISPLL